MKPNTITTGADGIAILSDIPVYNSENEKIEYIISEKDVPIRYLLYLGKYEVKEIKAPYGYVQNAVSETVELTYAGQEI